MDFKVDDRVKLSVNSEYYRGGSGGNPIDAEGTIIFIGERGDLPIKVRWDNDRINVYDAKDLVLVKSLPEENKSRGPAFEELSREEQIAIFTAWLDGKEVEIRDTEDLNKWHKITVPAWLTSNMPRIAKTKPSVNWDHLKPEYIAIARDASGSAYGYVGHPVKQIRSWTYPGKCIHVHMLSSFDPGTCDWEDSLIMRPGSE